MNTLVHTLTPRRIFIAIALLCLAFLATAYYLQYGPDKQQPCPLCILQRYAYIFIAAISLIAAYHNPRNISLLFYALLGDALALTGLGFAVWQVTKGASMTTCLADPIGVFVNGLPAANWWPSFFFANGSCADQYSPVLGIAVPVWSLIWFAVFSMALGFIASRALVLKIQNKI